MGEYVNLNQANNNIDLDKRIKFKCSQCGKCCYQRNINAVEYNPYDIYRLSKFLGLSIPEFIDKYGVLDKDEMNFPVIKLRTKQYRGQCLFLKKGKCTVHEVKPLACALFPLGRGFNIIEDKYMYVWQGCPRASDDGQITPREWLERFGI